jgi:cell division protease FtsH
MVTKYGFSDKIGPVNYSSADEVFLGKDFSTRKNYSEEMASEIDEEVRALIEDAYTTAENILKERFNELRVIANALLEAETLDGEQFEDLFTGKITPEQLIETIERDEKHIREKNAKEAAETEMLLSLPEEEEEYEDEDAEERGEAEAAGKRQEYKEYNASGEIRKSFRIKTRKLPAAGAAAKPVAKEDETESNDKGNAG